MGLRICCGLFACYRSFSLFSEAECIDGRLSMNFTDCWIPGRNDIFSARHLLG